MASVASMNGAPRMAPTPTSCRRLAGREQDRDDRDHRLGQGRADRRQDRADGALGQLELAAEPFDAVGEQLRAEQDDDERDDEDEEVHRSGRQPAMAVPTPIAMTTRIAIEIATISRSPRPRVADTPATTTRPIGVAMTASEAEPQERRRAPGRAATRRASAGRTAAAAVQRRDAVGDHQHDPDDEQPDRDVGERRSSRRPLSALERSWPGSTRSRRHVPSAAHAASGLAV